MGGFCSRALNASSPSEAKAIPQNKSGQSQLELLPQEVLIIIFSNLGISDLESMMATCKYFYYLLPSLPIVARAPKLNYGFNFENKFFSEKRFIPDNFHKSFADDEKSTLMCLNTLSGTNWILSGVDSVNLSCLSPRDVKENDKVGEFVRKHINFANEVRIYCADAYLERNLNVLQGVSTLERFYFNFCQPNGSELEVNLLCDAEILNTMQEMYAHMLSKVRVQAKCKWLILGGCPVPLVLSLQRIFPNISSLTFYDYFYKEMEWSAEYVALVARALLFWNQADFHLFFASSSLRESVEHKITPLLKFKKAPILEEGEMVSPMNEDFALHFRR